MKFFPVENDLVKVLSLWQIILYATCNPSKFHNLLVSPLPFNSHEWPRQNFSLQYQYIIKQTSDENNEMNNEKSQL